MNAMSDRWLEGERTRISRTAEKYRKLDIVELLKQRVTNAMIQLAKDEDLRDYRVILTNADDSDRS
jgi:hypothetical protein